MIGTRDRAIAAANAFLGRPADNASFRILVQGLEWAAGGASGIETMHALTLHKRKCRAIFWFIELDDIAGDVVQVRGRLMERVGARVGRSIVGLGAGGHASLATDADGGVVQQSHGRIGDGNGLAACSASLPTVTTTAAGTLALATPVISSRRVMATFSPLSCQSAC